MLRKVLRWIAIVVACLLVLAVCSALLYRKYLQHQRVQARAIHTPNGINSFEDVPINGINQWIQVRGQNVDNPILLWIHGGPGIAFIPLSATFQDPLEKYFTVVEWDQRGAGKTLASNDLELQRRTLKVSQMQQDALEVVNYLCKRFHRPKIFVVGHSWGSVLGLWLAHQDPGQLYAYVGTGQVVNFTQNEQVAFNDALPQARNVHDAQAIKELEAIAPYPGPNVSDENVGMAKGWENYLLSLRGIPNFTDPHLLIHALISAPEYSLRDDVDFIGGMSISRQVMLPELMKVDLTQLGLSFQTSVMFFEGHYDPYCRSSLVEGYYRSIRAPRKQLIWFERSGHFPFFEEPQKFRDSLVQQLLPLVASP
jgi:proline iminopeptidase